MLIVNVTVNKKEEVAELWIHNTKVVNIDENGELCLYKIVRPEGYKDKEIYHFKKEGWKSLLRKVLEKMEDK